MTSTRTAAVLLLVLVSSCQPASQGPNGGAAAPAASSRDQAAKRPAVRACVLSCDKKHERENPAHVGCVRRCLGIEHAPGGAEKEAGTGAPWAILFAIGVSSALAVLVLLF